MLQFVFSCASLLNVIPLLLLYLQINVIHTSFLSIFYNFLIYTSLLFIGAESTYRKEQKLWYCMKSSLLAGPFCYSGGFSIVLHIRTFVPVDIVHGLLEALKGTCSRDISGTTNKQDNASSGEIPLLRRAMQTAKSRRACFQVQRLFVIYLY